MTTLAEYRTKAREREFVRRAMAAKGLMNVWDGIEPELILPRYMEEDPPIITIKPTRR